MIWKILLLSIGMMGVVAFLMSFNVIFRKKRFPNSHIGASREMAKRGISCATSQDREARQKGTAF
ncbi:hypothetical protein ACT3CD_08145 [Geofilum sp. OHC36d9]|uniref:hypothetical protein n=1 Tax=Geofilum sp. OHC36d9 TaxID=3458413 RepID=UPI004034793A